MSAVPAASRDWRAALAPVAAEFALAGELTAVAPHPGGHINETFVLTTRPPAGS
ncbi:MAG: hypothetical protein JNL39_20240, partial [Opitutaceae bacterium]|nr:hypothetical protein [Opitutaceae bacterium]